MYQPKVSIIIPVRQVNKYLKEHLPKYLELDYPDFEVLVHVDQKNPEPNEQWEKVKIIYQPGVSAPPQKRNSLANMAQGEILAFIDDDAYPDPQWLAEAVKWFTDERIAGVGGPNLTHPQDNLWQRVGGLVLGSWLGSGGSGLNRVEKIQKYKGKEIKDWASVNLLVRKSDFEEVGGYVSQYYPGEDTKLCLDLTKKLNKKVIYEPEAIVFHHRRAIFLPHLKQVGTYGRHRGRFARIYPQTSRKLGYFLPSLFTIGLIVGLPAGLIFAPLLHLYITIVSLYLLLLVYTAYQTYQKTHRLLESFLIMPAIFATHFWYGLMFLKGLFSPEYGGRGNY